MNGGRFDFDDGGSYCGGWEEGKAHGHGVCTGPQGKGEFAGAWHYGFEVSGVYTWPSGNTYQGQWQNGKRHGLGVEQRGRWIYKGEWTQGFKGRYGLRQSTSSQARYQGTWSAGFHDGYGTETYVDGGSYQGQWLRGMRHGYGVRKSASYANAATFRSKSQTHASLTSLRSGRNDRDEDEDDDTSKHRVEGRGGFVLRANSTAPARRRRSLSERSLAVKRTILSGLRIKKQHSTGDIHQRVTSMTGSLRSSGSTMSCASEDSLHKRGDFVCAEEEQVEEGTTETYNGEWKNDARCGFGVCERTDGLKYHGEWANNTKNGYGVTTLRDGSREEGKYKNNVLVVSARRKGVLFVRGSKLRERVEASVEAAQRAASIAQQKADIAASRTSTAKERAEQATFVGLQAREDSDMARIHAKQFDPNFKQPGAEWAMAFAQQQQMHMNYANYNGGTDTLRRQMQEHHGGESFQTDGSDPAAPYSRHLSQHSKPSSFEQSLSVDRTDVPSDVYSQSQPIGNHVAFQDNSPGHGWHPDMHLPQGMHPQGMSPQGMNMLSAQAMMLQQQMLMQQQHYYQQQQQQQQHQQPHFELHEPVMTPQLVVEEASPAAAQSPLASPDQSAKQSTEQPKEQEQEEEKNSLSANAFAPLSTMNSQQSSSRFSLSDDHFDQYVMAGGGAQARIKRNRPSLTRQPDHVNENNANLLNRRSTLASSRDRRTEAVGAAAAAAAAADTPTGDNMGSLPNLAHLEGTGLRLRREDAARLASQRRQEVLRDAEEQELLRQNPLRYIWHPAFRAWLVKWKVPLLLAAANLSLLVLFYNLLTYEKRRVR